MITKTKPVIGIIGGMGPQASVAFYDMIIRKCSLHGVHANDYYPELLIDSIPVPDFISDTESLPLAKTMLIDRVKRLNQFGVDKLCIACNTAHILLADLQQASLAPFISIIDAVKKSALQNKFSRIGLLASPVTIKTGLYSNVVSAQEDSDPLIRRVIAGENIQMLQKEFEKQLDEFVINNQLDAVILGCTELPLICPAETVVPVINSLECLADAVVKEAYV